MSIAVIFNTVSERCLGAADDGKRFAALDVAITAASRREDYGIWVGFRGG